MRHKHLFAPLTLYVLIAGGTPTRSGRDSAGEGLLCGQPDHRCHTQGHRHLREEGGRRQPGSREHLRNDRGESGPPLSLLPIRERMPKLKPGS